MSIGQTNRSIGRVHAMKFVKYGIVAVVALLIGVAIGAAGASDTTDTAGDRSAKAPSSSPAPDATQEATPEPVEPDPQAKHNLHCAYVLGDFGDSGDPAKGYRFIGGGKVRNTGNVGVVVRASFSWDQLGQVPIKQRRTVRLAVGKSKRISVTVPATQDQIDLHQSGDSDCAARVSIVDTFGEPQP